MPLFEDQDDLGAATAAVLLAILAIGAFIYGYNRVEEVQTALNLPSIEKIVPLIPSPPQMR
jgi:hypothetical protein